MNCEKGNDQFGNYEYYWGTERVSDPWETSQKTTACFLETYEFMTETTDTKGQKIAVYRPDKDTSSKFGQEGGEPGKCSVSYMISFLPMTETKERQYPYGCIKLKIPQYYQSWKCTSTDMTTDVYYFSITSGQNQDSMVMYPFWTITSQMLVEQQRTDGYAFVFWGPSDFVQQFPKKSLDQAPVMQIQGTTPWKEKKISKEYCL